MIEGLDIRNDSHQKLIDKINEIIDKINEIVDWINSHSSNFAVAENQMGVSESAQVANSKQLPIGKEPRPDINTLCCGHLDCLKWVAFSLQDMKNQTLDEVERFVDLISFKTYGEDEIKLRVKVLKNKLRDMKT